MEYTKQGRRNRTFIIIWTIAVIGFIYLPVLCDAYLHFQRSLLHVPY